MAHARQSSPTQSGFLTDDTLGAVDVPQSLHRAESPIHAAAMEFSLLCRLLNTEVVYVTAGFQFRYQPARLLATTGPGLGRIFGIEKLGKDGWICSTFARSRLRLATGRRLKRRKTPLK